MDGMGHRGLTETDIALLARAARLAWGSIPVGERIHSFDASEAHGYQPEAFDAFYRTVWPDLEHIDRTPRGNSPRQKAGIDVGVRLSSGRLVMIDEKFRSARDPDGDPYEDFLLEEWSVYYGDADPRNKVGWSLDQHKRCDFIAYGQPLLERCYLLPFVRLRLAGVRMLPVWKQRRDAKGRPCYPLDAPNRGYLTRNCAVSWPDLAQALLISQSFAVVPRCLHCRREVAGASEMNPVVCVFCSGIFNGWVVQA
jgi:hypothetical protein